MRSRSPWSVLLVTLAIGAIGGGGGCKPANVEQAETKGDVAWLDQNGTPEALAALGRLADKNAKAAAAVESRAASDPSAWAVAWAAVVRGAAWGSEMLKRGLADASHAEQAASAMGRRDPHLAAFVGELDAALVRLAASQQNAAVSTVLASAGAPAHDAVERRLADGATRGAMCRGIASPVSSVEARKSLVGVPPASRDNAYCVDAVVKLAVDDEPTFAWLAKESEPGILGAASKSELMPCGRLHALWRKSLAERAAELHTALMVPLSHAVKRCAPEMDGVLADALAHQPATHAVVVGGIDPFASYAGHLKATCAALPSVAANARNSSVTRERARDAIARSCTMR